MLAKAESGRPTLVVLLLLGLLVKLMLGLQLLIDLLMQQ